MAMSSLDNCGLALTSAPSNGAPRIPQELSGSGRNQQPADGPAPSSLEQGMLHGPGRAEGESHELNGRYFRLTAAIDCAQNMALQTAMQRTPRRILSRRQPNRTGCAKVTPLLPRQSETWSQQETQESSRLVASRRSTRLDGNTPTPGMIPQEGSSMVWPPWSPWAFRRSSCVISR